MAYSDQGLQTFIRTDTTRNTWTVVIFKPKMKKIFYYESYVSEADALWMALRVMTERSYRYKEHPIQLTWQERIQGDWVYRTWKRDEPRLMFGEDCKEQWKQVHLINGWDIRGGTE